MSFDYFSVSPNPNMKPIEARNDSLNGEHWILEDVHIKDGNYVLSIVSSIKGGMNPDCLPILEKMECVNYRSFLEL